MCLLGNFGESVSSAKDADIVHSGGGRTTSPGAIAIGGIAVTFITVAFATGTAVTAATSAAEAFAAAVADGAIVEGTDCATVCFVYYG